MRNSSLLVEIISKYPRQKKKRFSLKLLKWFRVTTEHISICYPNLTIDKLSKISNHDNGISSDTCPGFAVNTTEQRY